MIYRGPVTQVLSAQYTSSLFILIKTQLFMCIKQHIQKAYKENSIASKTNAYLEHGGKETLEVNVCASLAAPAPLE